MTRHLTTVCRRVQRGLTNSASKHPSDGPLRYHHGLRNRLPNPSLVKSLLPAHVSQQTRPFASETSSPSSRKVTLDYGPPRTPSEASPEGAETGSRKQKVAVRVNSEFHGYPAFWLRDHCLCHVCSHPSTHQRQHDTFGLDPDIEVKDLSSTSEGLQITWSGEDAHVSFYPWDWLDDRQALFKLSKKSERQWTPFTTSSARPRTSFSSLTASDPIPGQKSLFANIHQHGLAFVPDTPPTPEATIDILNTLGPIRHTHYGGFWDFTSEVNPIDTAYTNLSLPLHTDTTYFTEPAGLQLFHLLSHMPSTTDTPQPGNFDPSLGGESTFCDGFAAAKALYQKNSKAYEVLANAPIIFAAEGSSAGAFRNNIVRPRGSPVFEHRGAGQPFTRGRPTPDRLTRVRWNNCDRSSLTKWFSHKHMLAWLEAARLWDEILQSGEFEVEVKLEPGEPVVFDNWRILHGRRKFEGKRRMCGGYTGMDDFRAGALRLGVLHGAD